MTSFVPYLNFGAGNPVEGWLNVDSSPWFLLPRSAHVVLAALHLSERSAAFARATYAWVRFVPDRPLPLPAESFEAVYCSHVLEHMPAYAIPHLLTEFHRVLKPGGVVRVLTPNPETAAQTVLSGCQAWAPVGTVFGTLPAAIARSRLRGALECLWGFPSVHKTLILERNVRTALEAMWDVRTGLTYLESEIDRALLERVEREERCNGASIFELAPKQH